MGKKTFVGEWLRIGKGFKGIKGWREAYLKDVTYWSRSLEFHQRVGNSIELCVLA